MRSAPLFLEPRSVGFDPVDSMIKFESILTPFNPTIMILHSATLNRSDGTSLALAPREPREQNQGTMISNNLGKILHQPEKSNNEDKSSSSFIRQAIKFLTKDHPELIATVFDSLFFDQGILGSVAVAPIHLLFYWLADLVPEIKIKYQGRIGMPPLSLA